MNMFARQIVEDSKKTYLDFINSNHVNETIEQACRLIDDKPHEVSYARENSLRLWGLVSSVFSHTETHAIFRDIFVNKPKTTSIVKDGVTHKLCWYFLVYDNEGSEHAVLIDVNSVWSDDTLIAYPDFPYSKKHKSYTVRRGTRGRPRAYLCIDRKTLYDSPEYKEYIEARNKLHTYDNARALIAAHEKCMELLRKELPDLDFFLYIDKKIQEGDFNTVRTAFLTAGFSNVPNVEELKNKMTRLGEYTLWSGRSYGHTEGVNVRIDIVNREFIRYGWDSSG